MKRYLSILCESEECVCGLIETSNGTLTDYSDAQSEITAAYQRGLEDAARVLDNASNVHLSGLKENSNYATLLKSYAERIRAKKEGGR